MSLSRRGLILGAGASLLAAPAIVRAASLMPVRPLSPKWKVTGFISYDDLKILEFAMRQNHIPPDENGFYHACVGSAAYGIVATGGWEHRPGLLTMVKQQIWMLPE